MNHRAKPSHFANRAFTAIALALSLTVTACNGAPDTAPQSEPPLAGADIGGEFELVNSKGEAVRWSDFKGKYRIVYFGYAYCPDICPTDVQRMSQGLKQFAKTQPDLAAKVQAIFITVDPERDTPEVVGEFTRAFSDDLIGLTGTPEQIAAAAKAFRVAFSRGAETSDGGYLMDHQRITFLFDPEGKPLSMLPTDQGADAVEQELAKWVK
jgi:protein SCO1/2